ncbi:MAG: carbamoyltransferase HypF [Thauera phenolivorans]|uniref:Carbamoyltransferase HypF n=1 Tax=Thauera phenolivorans TaxID=1792543 RepID=A0A7X7LW26_9RHOO|nr:carbamoyltransferase HypF [Thauera phenolivorans]
MSAPRVVALPVEHRLALPPGPPVLATGAWFRNTVCAARGGEAHLSATVGDLESVDACRAHEAVARELLDWLGAPPAAIAHDLHPDFHSSRFAAELAEACGARLVGVQHHHAHIAATCAEHGERGPVLGLALDGVGLGSDGAAWGGELLRVEGARCARLASLRPLALPGGDRAAREPWRMAAAALYALGRGDEIEVRFDGLPAAGVARLLETGLRCPPSSSMGRVFDAAAGLLGLCRVMRDEAEAAIALERAATRHGACAPLDAGWRIDADGRLDLRPLLAELADTQDAGGGAALFHATLGAALVDWALRAAQSAGLATVAVGGGCFFNALLAADLRARFAAAGLRLLAPRHLLPGDTAIAYGQAAVARFELEGN